VGALIDIGGEALVYGFFECLLVDTPVSEFNTVHQDDGNELAVQLGPQRIVLERDFFGDNVRVGLSHPVDDDFRIITQVTPGLPNERHRHRHVPHLMLK